MKVVGQLEAPASVSVCLDGSCVVAPWPSGGSGCEEVKADWRLSVCLQDDGSMTTLAFPGESQVEDGVKFEIVMADAAGQTLLHESEIVEFSDSYPNGKRCPGHCRYANYRY